MTTLEWFLTVCGMSAVGALVFTGMGYLIVWITGTDSYDGHD